MYFSSEFIERIKGMSSGIVLAVLISVVNILVSVANIAMSYTKRQNFKIV